jgi:hypothetical protein
MKKSINLPFTTDIKGGNNKSFKILNEEQVINNIKNKSIFNFLKKMLYSNQNNNTNKINYVKASSTKKYYEKINKNKK